MKIQQLFIHFGGAKKTFLEGEKVFLSSFFKVYNKVQMTTTKKFIFSFWFQFIQRIVEQELTKMSTFFRQHAVEINSYLNDMIE
jgi:hypothetical protein